MANCPFCAESVPEGAAACVHCGSDLTKPAGTPPLQVVPTSGKALASMVLGILGWLWFTAILALIFGYTARSEIRNSNGKLAGEEMARAGIILGWSYAPFLAIFPILIIAAIAIPNLLRSKTAANEASAVGTTRLIVTCAVVYQTGRAVFPANLDEMGPTGDGCLDDVAASGSKSGYTFSYLPTNSGFTITATPTSCERTARRTFFTDETGVIRFRNDAGCPAATAESPPL